jgi:septal ring factor EnvC (AmiA/AmiB activator)
VNPALVLPDKEGKPYTVRYDAVNAMLLNEFLKQHKAFVEERHKVEKLEATVAQQHKDFEAAVAELKGQIQKVSAHLELGKAAPQTVLNNQ